MPIMDEWSAKASLKPQTRYCIMIIANNNAFISGKGPNITKGTKIIQIYFFDLIFSHVGIHDLARKGHSF